MPSLRVTQPGRGVKIHPLHKKITSIGRSEENDIALDDPLLDPSHIHIHFDGRDFNVTSID
ncbi:MAG TPA: FHA domain-containing protein, partial [Polyangia bacterium]